MTLRARRRALRGCLTGTLLLLSAAALAPAASASTLAYQDVCTRFVQGPSGPMCLSREQRYVITGEAEGDTIGLNRSPSNVIGGGSETLRFTDDDWVVDATASNEGCTASGTTASCPPDTIDRVIVNAGDGNDTVEAGVGSNNFPNITPAWSLPLTLNGENGADTLRGGTGADLLNGGTTNHNDQLDGRGGDDVLFGGPNFSGICTVFSCPDPERLFGGPGNDELNGEDGGDDLFGDADDDTLNGGAGNDELHGGLGVDELFGQGNNDALDGGPGRETTMDGGTESDTAVFLDGRTAGVTVALAAGTAGGADDGDTPETLVAIEHLAGSQFQDTLTGDANANTLNGFGGSDILNGADGSDSLLGGNEDDTLDGGTGGDALNGEGGGADVVTYSTRTTEQTVTLDAGANDDGGTEDGAAGSRDNVTNVENVIGGAARDVITGNAAANHLFGGPGNDDLFGAAGDDTLDGGSGPDVLDGQAGRDAVTYAGFAAGVTVTTGAGADDGPAGEGDDVKEADVLVGSAHDDFLSGDVNPNRLEGGAGNDVLRGGAGTDEHVGGDGSDTADYGDRSGGVTVTLNETADDGESGENDTIAADVENVAGGGGDDRITGSNGANVLTGRGGNDVIDGLFGADAFSGGAGNDTLKARDGVDGEVVDCGEGTDGGDADQADKLTSCEGINPPVVVSDADKDGIADAQDCDDANPAIKPGAQEIVGNDVDENCDGIKARFQLIGATVKNSFAFARTFTIVRTLTARNIPAGGRLKIQCKAPKGKKRACPLRVKSFSFSKATPSKAVAKLFKKRRLPVGTKIIVTLSAPNQLTKKLTYTVRRGKAPSLKTTCARPDTGQATPCV